MRARTSTCGTYWCKVLGHAASTPLLSNLLSDMANDVLAGALCSTGNFILDRGHKGEGVQLQHLR